MSNKRHRSAGFTLVEIVTVVTILAILALLALPNIASQADLTASAASRVVVSDLLYAQSQAISTGSSQYVYVNFTVASSVGSWGEYSLYNDPAPTLQTPVKNPISGQDSYSQSFGPGAGGPFASVALTDVNLGTGNMVLAFDELGRPYVGAVNGTFSPLANPGSIALQCGSMTVTISIEPSTGNIAVSP